MTRRRGPPGRETAAARTTERRTWYGYGHLTRTEKSGVGVFLHDATRIFAEVTVFSLPVLLFVMDYPATGWFDAKATGLVAWAVAVFIGTLVRGGWIRPLATDTLGWVTLAPSLLVLRIPYYNGVMALAVFGGLAVGGRVAASVDPGIGVGAGLGATVLVALVGVLAFPRIAEAWLERLG